MTRRRVLLALMLALGAALLVATTWNARELRRAWATRNDVRVVRTLEELERQREVVIDGIPVKLGVETLTPAPGGATLVYALWSGPAELDGLVFGGEKAFLRYDGFVLKGRSGPRLWVRSLAVPLAGEKVQEIVDRRGEVRARFLTVAAGPPFHAFFPLDGTLFDRERHLGVGAAVPNVDGESALATDLPRIFVDDSSPSMGLTSDGATFTLALGRDLHGPDLGVPPNALLCRLWKNGVPLQPPPGRELADRVVALTRELGKSAPPSPFAFRLSLDPDRLGLRPGDRVGAQVFLGGGWHPSRSPGLMQASSYPWSLALLSNRVEFTLP